MSYKRLAIVLALFLVLVLAGSAAAQEEPELTLRLSRDFGYGSGSQVQGTFSYRVEAPETVERVEFLLDDNVVGEDVEPPFRLQFKTDNYELGWHNLRAVGYTSAGQMLRSNTVQRQFVSPQQSYTVVLAILGLVVGFAVLRYMVVNRGNEGKPRKGYGFFGGAICPRCGRPFALHAWSINLMAGRLDRCPHCGKWSFVQRASPQMLAQAEEEEEVEAPLERPEDEEARLRRLLDDSRFNE